MSQQFDFTLPGNLIGPEWSSRPSVVSPAWQFGEPWRSVRPKLGCKCGQEASYRLLATKTEPVRDSDALAVVEQREAVWCASCGVIAWVV